MSAAADESPRPLSAFHFQPGGDVKYVRHLGWAALLSAVMLVAGWTKPALAQRSLRGTVTDLDTGSPIGLARVTVKGTSLGAATGSDGVFTLTAVPEGALTLEVRRIGYQLASVSVAADQNNVEVKLRATPVQLSEQVVTGQATTVARRRSKRASDTWRLTDSNVVCMCGISWKKSHQPPEAIHTLWPFAASASRTTSTGVSSSNR